jgi:hypothetical protein
MCKTWPVPSSILTFEATGQETSLFGDLVAGAGVTGDLVAGAGVTGDFVAGAGVTGDLVAGAVVTGDWVVEAAREYLTVPELSMQRNSTHTL